MTPEQYAIHKQALLDAYAALGRDAKGISDAKIAIAEMEDDGNDESFVLGILASKICDLVKIHERFYVRRGH